MIVRDVENVGGYEHNSGEADEYVCCDAYKSIVRCLGSDLFRG